MAYIGKSSYNITEKATWIVLVAGLMIVIVTTMRMKSNMDRMAEQEFVSHCSALEDLISYRMDDYTRILVSGVGLFDAFDEVTRKDWHIIFNGQQKIVKNLPNGVQGFGFSLLVPRAELSRHIQDIRSEGFPDYTVKPAGDRAIYSSIIYLEPFSDRNLRTFGYDMLNEPVRRAAMEKARDTGFAVLSDKVTLVQETDRNIQVGTLLYVPVYRKAMPTDTVEQRRAAIYGWVYSPYRMNDLIQGIFRGLRLEEKNDFHFEIFSGRNTSPQNLLYENFPAENNHERSPVRFIRQTSHVFNCAMWTLCFTQTGGGFYTAEYVMVWLSLIGSAIILLLLFILVMLLLKTREAARQMAEKLTVALGEKTSILSDLLNSIPEIVFFKTKEGVYLGCNHEFARFANRNMSDIVGLTDYALFDKELADSFRTNDMFAMESNQPTHNKEWIQYPDGARILLHMLKAPLTDDEGRVLGLLGIGHNITELEQAKTELQNISDRLSLAVRVGGVGVWDLNVTTNNLVWDDQMLRLYGIVRDKFSSVYEAWQMGLHPEDRQRGEEEIRLALSGEKDFDTEFRVIWPDGTIRNIRALATVQRDAAGHPVHMLGTNWDITAQKQMENTKIQLIHDLDERIKELNCMYAINELASTTDISFEHILQGIVDLIPPALQYPELTCAKLAINGQVFTTGNYIETLWMETSSILLDGAPVGLLKICYLKEQLLSGKTSFLNEERLLIKAVAERIGKIYDRKLVETRIVEKEEEIHLLLDSTAEAIYGLDMNGNCTFCNNSCLRLLGYTLPDELLGKNMHLQIHSKYPDGSHFPVEECRIFQAFNKGKGTHVDDEVLWRADGTSFSSEYWSFPQRKDGVIVGAVVTFLDITERRHLEAEKAKLEKENRQLQKSESLGRMSGAIAHHFNNKLNVVMGYLEMVIRELPPGDSNAVKLAKSLQAAQSAAEVSANLLAYIGQTRNKVESLDLSEICTVYLPVLMTGIAKNVALKTYLPSLGPQINADAKQIQKILDILVTNAWEAVGEGIGTIHLSVKIVSKADISASHRFPPEWHPQEQAYVCLEVKDSGCGIQEEDIEKIFDPFFSTKFTGRGLGLSIVLGIVKTHGAAITVKSKIGNGSVFRVFFSLSVQAEAKQDKQIAKAPDFVAGGMVLLVEDDAVLREMTKIALVTLGFQVLEAKDGVEAVEIFKKQKNEISCVLSDLTMPNMGGWETITALRAIRHGLPVILVSGYDEGTVMLGEHPELPDVFLNKPYKINNLKDAIECAMARRPIVSL